MSTQNSISNSEVLHPLILTPSRQDSYEQFDVVQKVKAKQKELANGLEDLFRYNLENKILRRWWVLVTP